MKEPHGSYDENYVEQARALLQEVRICCHRSRSPWPCSRSCNNLLAIRGIGAFVIGVVSIPSANGSPPSCSDSSIYRPGLCGASSTQTSSKSAGSSASP